MAANAQGRIPGCKAPLGRAERGSRCIVLTRGSAAGEYDAADRAEEGAGGGSGG